MLYGIIATLSWIIRVLVLPNPFEVLGESFTINLFGLSFATTPFIFNFFIMSVILYLITYPIVGLYYTKGSNGAWGSFLYLMFYCIHTGLLFIMSWFNFSIPAIVIVLIGYAMLHVGYNCLKNKFRYGGV